MHIETNFLVIGSGIAGLTFAVKIAEKFPQKNVVIVTKSNEDESNTKYAQGGVAVVWDQKEDSFQKHIQDTLIAGDGLCDEEVVEMVVNEGPERLRELIEWGANFDEGSNGELDLGREGGHSAYRVVHHKDITGKAVEEALLQKIKRLTNVSILAHHFSIDLITIDQLNRESYCVGAYVLDQKTGEVIAIKADSTLLASGGIGCVYGHTTNPDIATGDGIAMASRAGVRIKEMEFIQFHPTVLYDEGDKNSFLISEAVRGFGAYLRNKKGVRFMPVFDDRAELAPRDVVSQTIDKELKGDGEVHVYLDCTHLDEKAFNSHFPNISKKCRANGIDISKDWIPVVPASHYLCGGIEVDRSGKTSLPGLYACGECSRTGLHGANRLASNSLLEALVYADRIYQYQVKHLPVTKEIEIPEWQGNKSTVSIDVDDLNCYKKQLQAIMREYAGIVRSNKGLLKAKKELRNIQIEIEEKYQKTTRNITLFEVKNMLIVASLIVNQSLNRNENRGGYYNIDHEV